MQKINRQKRGNSGNSLRGDSGNILFIILLAIGILALLTYALSRSSEQQSQGVDRQVSDDEIYHLFTQVAAINGAVNQMVENGKHPDDLDTDISALKPGDGGYEAAPHDTKIYHPMGGGVGYLAASSTAATPVANNFKINATSIVTGVGATDVTEGDILFTATVSSLAACQRINELALGSAAVPTLATASFDALVTAGTTVTIAAGNCPSCVGVPKICVTNTGGTAWGYYAVLLPQ
jgi:hypothetical protein